MIRIFLVVLMVFICVGSVSAQEKKLVKRIYLVDVTKSMIGEGKINGKKNATEDIFSSLRRNLANIMCDNCAVCDDDEIVIIPFTNKTFNAIRGYGRNRREIADSIIELTTRPGDTNIDAAWLAGINELDSNKINLLFLMTDGIHNYGPDVNVLYQHLEEWRDDQDNLAFYFMLTDNAESQKIKDIADTKSTMIAKRISNIKIDILQLSASYRITFKGENASFKMTSLSNSCCPQELDCVVLTLDNNANYSIDRYHIYTNKVEFSIKGKCPRNLRPLSEDNSLTFSWNDKQIFILPKKVNIQINNIDTRTMIIR